jgi:hypothetical protein
VAALIPGLSEQHKKFGTAFAVYFLFAGIILTGGVQALFEDKRLAFAPGLLVMGIGFGLLAYDISKEGEFRKGSARSVSADRTLRLRLMWTHQFQFIGIYRAVDLINDVLKNLKAGADPPYALKVLEGGSPIGLDPRATVFNGLDDLGITSATALIRWYLRHHSSERGPGTLVPLLVIFQRSPACLIYRVQPALPENGIKVEHLTGKRFRFSDPADPATMEFLTLCRKSHVQNVQWNSSGGVEEDPTDRLEEGGTVDYRLGYSFNEGYRATRTGDAEGEYAYSLLTHIFSQTDLYADVLFTRKEIMGNPKRAAAVREVAAKIEESYAFFVDRDKDRAAEVNKYLEEYCHDWWHMVKGKHQLYDTPAKELIELLKEAWGSPRPSERLLGNRNCWKELEQAVQAEQLSKSSALPHFDWLTSGPTAHSLE